MSPKQNSRRRVVNAALNAQWIVTATYRSERGPVVLVNHIKELQDLADLIEDGPWFDTLIEAQVVPNPLQPTYFRAIPKITNKKREAENRDEETYPCWIVTATYRSKTNPIVVVYRVEDLSELPRVVGSNWDALVEMKVILKPSNSLWPGLTIEAAAKLEQSVF